MSKKVEKCMVVREFNNDGKSIEEIIQEILNSKVNGDLYAS